MIGFVGGKFFTLPWGSITGDMRIELAKDRLAKELTAFTHLSSGNTQKNVTLQTVNDRGFYCTLLYWISQVLLFFFFFKLRQDPLPAKRLLCVLGHYGGLEPNCNIFKVCLPILNLIREGVGRKGLWEEQMGF